MNVGRAATVGLAPAGTHTRSTAKGAPMQPDADIQLLGVVTAIHVNGGVSATVTGHGSDGYANGGFAVSDVAGEFDTVVLCTRVDAVNDYAVDRPCLSADTVILGRSITFFG